jgi:pilus assembly protein Flp/PilA
MNDKLLKLHTAVQARMADDREEGATAVEYGLIVALIAAVIAGTVGLLGLQVNAAFEAVRAAIAAAL